MSNAMLTTTVRSSPPAKIALLDSLHEQKVFNIEVSTTLMKFSIYSNYIIVEFGGGLNIAPGALSRHRHACNPMSFKTVLTQKRYYFISKYKSRDRYVLRRTTKLLVLERRFSSIEKGHTLAMVSCRHW